MAGDWRPFSACVERRPGAALRMKVYQPISKSPCRNGQKMLYRITMFATRIMTQLRIRRAPKLLLYNDYDR